MAVAGRAQAFGQLATCDEIRGAAHVREAGQQRWAEAQIGLPATSADDVLANQAADVAFDKCRGDLTFDRELVPLIVFTAVTFMVDLLSIHEAWQRALVRRVNSLRARG